MVRRFSVFSLALLLCLSLFPARAFADVGSSSVLWSGSINDGSQFGAFVKGGTRYDAAAAALGYDSSRLSDEVKAKLSDSAHGGMFYVFANAFSSVSSPVEIPSWVPAFVTTSSVIADLLNNISGSNYPHWSVAVSQSVYDLALRDFLVVLNGGDLGGGSDGSIVGWSSHDATPYDSNLPGNYDYVAEGTPVVSATIIDGNVVVGSGVRRISPFVNSTYYVSSIRLYVSPTVAQLVNARLSDGYQVVFTVSGNDVGFVVGKDFVKSYDLDSSNRYRRYVYHSSVDISYYYWNVETGYYDAESPFYVYPDNSSYSSRNLGSAVALPFYSDVFDAPTVTPPAGIWPDPETPAAPVEPELPDPVTPTVETPVTPTVPAPVWPDITINIDVDPTPGTTPSGLDYTELLTRINDNLISIDAFTRAINSNLNSLRSDLLAEFNGVYDSLRNIYSYLLTIDTVLETHCVHLRNKMEESAVFIANYMRTLIKWLADQLDYDDLTNVEAPDNSLLTTINEKLGGGTYEPNPIKDEQGYYEWLDDLWDRFLLGDNWQTSMGNISGSFSELKTRFPFSVPWDIVALFRLFVHDPVTPVFDLPLYFSADGSTPVHVDLSPWDSVASLVRPMIFVIFALKLALLSRDLLGGLGADKGGL